MSTLLTTDVCPEVLTEGNLNVLRLVLNVKTLEDFLKTDPEKLFKAIAYSKVSPENKSAFTIDKILKLRQQIFADSSIFISNLGDEFEKERFEEDELPILTGLGTLDNISECDQGLFTMGKIYEIFGGPGVGKTQFSLFLATKVSLSDVGGGNVLYIDTKNDFCIERLVEIIDSTLSTKINDAKTGTKINDALEKIHVCKVNDLTTLGNVLHMIDGSKDEFVQGCRLLVIDNIASLVSPLLLRTDQVPIVFGVVQSVVKILRKIAALKNLVVLVVNGANTSSKSRRKPALGKMFKAACHTRLLLERISAQQVSTDQSVPCRLTVTKSDVIESGLEFEVKLTSRGFESFPT